MDSQLRIYSSSIHHKNKLTSIYKHNESIKVKKGDFVMSGEVIALSGNTGELTTGPHLHFEIWDSQGPLNPEDLISFLRCYFKKIFCKNICLCCCK